ncbi:EamA family transporter [Flavobacterium gilvum]|uniref:Transporter n=1 Tax=Flavobacterium gilvum TaxID=1492737 RepID=A0AAC9N666_9FLAO|nr:EamA family transporter [Flavobacterium gilvum]AOW10062.1 transporter [Flavobacterium gilvum]KFC58682.1 transporter [Flavobacterium gilvum]
MLFLLLSVICSVTVGVIFKIARIYGTSSMQIVGYNYLFALMLCYLFFSPDLKALDVSSPWEVLIPLGILLPVVFLLLAASIKHMGIAKTDVAQRLSLIISILGAWLFFGEQFSGLKLTALLFGFPAIILILDKPVGNKENKWIYPALVLVGFGVIDILFKQIALTSVLPFTTSLFVLFLISFFIMIFFNGYEMLSRKVKMGFKSIIFGGLVGIFNFGNILFYLKAHQVFAQNPSTVFAGMNMGVIMIGSLVGVFVFKEKVTKLNIIGLLLALLAVVFIVASQLN